MKQVSVLCFLSHMQVYILAMHQWDMAGQQWQQGSGWTAVASCLSYLRALTLLWLMPVVLAWAAHMAAACVWRQLCGSSEQSAHEVMPPLAESIAQVRSLKAVIGTSVAVRCVCRPSQQVAPMPPLCSSTDPCFVWFWCAVLRTRVRAMQATAWLTQLHPVTLTGQHAIAARRVQQQPPEGVRQADKSAPNMVTASPQQQQLRGHTQAVPKLRLEHCSSSRRTPDAAAAAAGDVATHEPEVLLLYSAPASPHLTAVPHRRSPGGGGSSDAGSSTVVGSSSVPGSSTASCIAADEGFVDAAATEADSDMPRSGVSGGGSSNSTAIAAGSRSGSRVCLQQQQQHAHYTRRVGPRVSAAGIPVDALGTPGFVAAVVDAFEGNVDAFEGRQQQLEPTSVEVGAQSTEARTTSAASAPPAMSFPGGRRSARTSSCSSSSSSAVSPAGAAVLSTAITATALARRMLSGLRAAVSALE